MALTQLALSTYLNQHPKKKKYFTTGPITSVVNDIDLNSDGINELLFLIDGYKIFSPSWENPIGLDNNNYLDLMVQKDLATEDINIFAFTDDGYIQKFKLDDDNKLTSLEIYYPDIPVDLINPEILYYYENKQVIIFHNGVEPEISIIELEPTIDFSKQRRIDGREANIILKAEFLYRHPIEKLKNYEFEEFQADSLPDGMRFNLNAFALDWTPSMNQLGFHELNYKTKFKANKSLIINNENGTYVAPEIHDTLITSSYLFYVNDLPAFSSNNTIDYLVVNKDTLNAYFLIKDRNIDAVINVGNNQYSASHIYKQPMIFENYNENTEIEEDSTENESDDANDQENTTAEDENTEIEEDSTENESDDANDQENTTAEDENTEIEEDSTENESDDANDQENTTAEDENTEIEEDSTENESDDANDQENTTAEDENISELDYSEIKKRQSQFIWSPDVDPGVYPFTLWLNDIHASDSIRINVRVHPRINLDDNTKDFILTVGKPFEYKLNIFQKTQTIKNIIFIFRMPLKICM